MTNIIMKAAFFAREAHEGQFRKNKKDPYIYHPARVAARYALLDGASEEGVAAAFLHDVLEDTKVHMVTLEEKFGTKVTQLVIALTNVSKGLVNTPRAERKKMDREWLARNGNPEVKRIKMLDRIDNLRDIESLDEDFIKLYAQESLLLAEAIGDADLALKKELIDTANNLFV